MSQSETYVYFALAGDEFDPAEITARLGITPTDCWRKGDPGLRGRPRHFSSWKWSTAKGTEPGCVERLVDAVVMRFEAVVGPIVQLKEELTLHSVLEIVLGVDMNQEEPTPALGHELRTLAFLHSTQTRTDVDIYRYDSRDQPA